MIPLFAAIPVAVTDVLVRVGFAIAVVPLLGWLVRGVCHRRWSFAAASTAWRAAVATVLLCGVAVGVVAATYAVADEARHAVAAEADRRQHDETDAAVLVALQQRYGVNVVGVSSWPILPDRFTPDLEVTLPSEPSDAVCVLRDVVDHADPSAPSGVDTPRPVAERVLDYRLLCDGEEVEPQGAVLGVRVETTTGDAWFTRYVVRAYAVALCGGVAAGGFLLYLLYCVGPPRGSSSEWSFVQDADRSALEEERARLLDQQRRRMASDRAEQRRVARFHDAREKDAERMFAGMSHPPRLREMLRLARTWEHGVDPAIDDPDDRGLAVYLAATGQDPAGVLRRPPDRATRGMLVAMLSLPLVGIVAWVASHADDDTRRRDDLFLTEQSVTAYVRHYTALGFDVDASEGRTEPLAGGHLSGITLTRGDEVCHGEIVAGFAVAACGDGHTYR